jgi:hypothetical protein
MQYMVWPRGNYKKEGTHNGSSPPNISTLIFSERDFSKRTARKQERRCFGRTAMGGCGVQICKHRDWIKKMRPSLILFIAIIIISDGVWYSSELSRRRIIKTQDEGFSRRNGKGIFLFDLSPRVLVFVSVAIIMRFLDGS